MVQADYGVSVQVAGSVLADFGFGGGDQPDVSAGLPVAVDPDGLADRLVEDQDVVGGLQSSVGV